MKEYLIFPLILCGCTPQTIQMAEDAIEGEAQVLEKVLQDAVPLQQRGPQVVTLKKPADAKPQR